MESLVKCAGCGKKPRIKANAQRRGWGHEVASPQGTSKTVLSPPQRGKNTQAYWAYKNAAQNQGGFTWGQLPVPLASCKPVCAVVTSIVIGSIFSNINNRWFVYLVLNSCFSSSLPSSLQTRHLNIAASSTN
jgi:hypothetical protein